ncbi:Hypothetical_protein [Hexamita inflata]|uniref:Hypothetical_protein n=1 Tax=Hexamita inflata TaxID=28002 RepID=A0AA86R0G5_9EUKA|nr:Hypothetical protein HINF_LOCUS50859 [Hexamita inflata]
MLSYDINSEWRPYCIKIERCIDQCKQLDDLDEILLEQLKKDKNILNNSNNSILKKIQDKSTGFIQEMQKDVYMVENFFSKRNQHQVVQKQKIPECIRKAAMLQNYTAYNHEQLMHVYNKFCYYKFILLWFQVKIQFWSEIKQQIFITIYYGPERPNSQMLGIVIIVIISFYYNITQQFTKFFEISICYCLGQSVQDNRKPLLSYLYLIVSTLQSFQQYYQCQVIEF